MDEITPLFAIEAEQLILSGFLEEAIELCINGLKVYPDYPTAKVILAKAYILTGQKEQSETILSLAKSDNYGKSLDRIDLNEIHQTIDNKEVFQTQAEANQDVVYKTSKEIIEPVVVINADISEVSSIDLESFNQDFKNLINNIDTSTKKEDIKTNNKPIIEIKKTEDPKIDRKIASNGKVEKNNSKLPTIDSHSKILSKNKDFFFHNEDLNNKIFSIEDSINNKIKGEEVIEIHSKQLTKLKVKQDTNDHESTKMLVMSLINTRFMKGKEENKLEEKAIDIPIYTETMAKIFTAQGAKDKAINIYQKLMISEPSKKDYYSSQIDKIS